MFQNIMNAVKKKKLFDKEYLLSLEVDEVLDLRDDEDFDKNWLRIYNELQRYELDEEKKMKLKKL